MEIQLHSNVKKPDISKYQVKYKAMQVVML